MASKRLGPPANKIFYLYGDILGNNIMYISEVETHKKDRQAKFKCHCGKEFRTGIYRITSSATKSCGCLNHLGLTRSHGMSGSREFYIWAHMKERCYSKNDKSYKHYGARGIKVCDRWLESFENFFSDMGLRPSTKHSIDRIDNDGDYCPENCKWVTQTYQNRNKRNNRYITWNGETLAASEWAERTGVRARSIIYRINQGYSVERAMSKEDFTPPAFKKRGVASI